LTKNGLLAFVNDAALSGKPNVSTLNSKRRKSMGEIKRPESPIVSKEEIERLGLTNSIVGHVIAAHRRGHITWVAALSLMVVLLAKDSEEKHKLLVAYIERYPRLLQISKDGHTFVQEEVE
jgi:hypothetical protein